jgi:hypothetical protein
MKAIQTLLILWLLGITFSCSSVYEVQYDYDQRAMRNLSGIIPRSSLQ